MFEKKPKAFHKKKHIEEKIHLLWSPVL